MKARSSRRLLTPALLVVLVPVVGCSGIGTHSPDSSGRLPFTESKQVVVPANTMVYVRLQEPINAATAKAGQTFNAVLDQPLVVDEQPVAPEGAEITGTVVAARESGRLHTAGYVRITLTSITLNGKPIALQTSTAIAGGASVKNRDLSFQGSGASRWLSQTFRSTESATHDGMQAGFEARRRIAFRLTQPLTVS